jgi:hypothetical protein
MEAVTTNIVIVIKEIIYAIHRGLNGFVRVLILLRNVDVL